MVDLQSETSTSDDSDATVIVKIFQVTVRMSVLKILVSCSYCYNWCLTSHLNTDTKKDQARV